MNKKYIVIIVLIIAVVVCATVYSVGNSKKNITVPAIHATTKVVGTSNWETYRNEKIGYEIRYPKELIGIENISTSTEGVTLALDNFVGVPKDKQKEWSQKGDISLSISLLVEKADNPKNLPIEQWVALNMEPLVKSYLSVPTSMPNSKNNVIVQGEPALHLERAVRGYGNGLYAYTDNVTFVMHNGYYYSISYSTLPANPTSEWKSHPYYKYLEQSVPITEAIINSFRFTK